MKRAVTFIHSPGKVLHDAPNDDDNDIKEFSRNLFDFVDFSGVFVPHKIEQNSRIGPFIHILV